MRPASPNEVRARHASGAPVPERGIYHGAPASALDVTVEVTRLA